MTEFELTCAECRDILDAFVEAEMAGQDVRRMYPHIWRHVSSCAICGPRYQALLQETRSSPTPYRSAGVAVSPRRLSFLPPAGVPAPPWVAHWRSGLVGAPFGLTYTLDPAYLRQRLLGPSTLITRLAGDPLGVEPKIMVQDIQSIGEQTIAVLVTGTLTLHQAGFLVVQASIASSETLAPELWATLTWAGQRETRPVDHNGVVDFSPVSLDPLLQHEADRAAFEVSFEVHEVGPS